MTRCFRVNARDNVATMLESGDGRLEIVGEAPGQILAAERIEVNHKVALGAISTGQSIVKFGVPIGTATRDILPGEWVHLHNCGSRFDERSRTLDGISGATTDTPYA